MRVGNMQNQVSGMQYAICSMQNAIPAARYAILVWQHGVRARYSLPVASPCLKLSRWGRRPVPSRSSARRHLTGKVRPTGPTSCRRRPQLLPRRRRRRRVVVVVVVVVASQVTYCLLLLLW